MKEISGSIFKHNYQQNENYLKAIPDKKIKTNKIFSFKTFVTFFVDTPPSHLS